MAEYGAHPSQRAIVDNQLQTAASRYPGRELKQVAEASCGVGQITDVLTSQARRVTAIDFTPTMLAEAQARWDDLAGVDFQLSSRQDFPWAEHPCDVTVTVRVLMHIFDEADLTQPCRATGRASRLVITGEYTSAATQVGARSRLRSPQQDTDLFGGQKPARETLDYAGDLSTFMLLEAGTR
ncbi:methyltransferase domain-containing protein [Streptomyces sp. NPDC005476]|uniref:class I SAM-dependent methyltransferase n=1 Tax=Streptomyces sp. NPDC005476 TaxID=3156882 RepID=UPI003454BD08